MKDMFPALRNFSLKEFTPFARYILAALIIFIAAVSSFLELAEEVSEGGTLAFDVRLLEALNLASSPLLDTLFLIVTSLGDVIFVALITVVAAILLHKRSKDRETIVLLSSVLGAVIVSHSLKLLFTRPRPDLWETLITETSFSFPSGHAIASSALAFSIGLILWRTRWRWIAAVIGVLYVLLVGLSRLYLGVHYPSDVIAGWLVSVCWVLTVIGVMTVWTVRRKSLINE